MPSLFGSPHERWPLSRAVDAMVGSARRAGFPALIWLAGLLYPTIGLGLSVVGPILLVLDVTTQAESDALRESVLAFLERWKIDSSGAQPIVVSLLDPAFDLGHLGMLFLLFPVTLAVARLSAGLAQVSERRVWTETAGEGRSPSLPATWKAGAGLSFSALGLVLSFPLLTAFAVLFLIAPVVLLLNVFEEVGQVPGVLALILSPVCVVAVIYVVVLQVLIQLALHSLARNRRGATSALTHAWRLVRNSPWSAARATLVDLALQSVVLVVIVVCDLLLYVPGDVLVFVLLGFTGVLRAGYWAATYEGLGGLSTARPSAPATPVPSSGSRPASA